MRHVRDAPTKSEAIYPHRDAVPCAIWRGLLGSAQREIGILDCSGLFLTEDPAALATLADSASNGVGVRICLYDSDAAEYVTGRLQNRCKTPIISNTEPLKQDQPAHELSGIAIRVARTIPNNLIYRADDNLLVMQLIYGVPIGRTPVLQLRRTNLGELMSTYLESFDAPGPKRGPLSSLHLTPTNSAADSRVLQFDLRRAQA